MRILSTFLTALYLFLGPQVSVWASGPSVAVSPSGNDCHELLTNVSVALDEIAELVVAASQHRDKMPEVAAAIDEEVARLTGALRAQAVAKRSDILEELQLRVARLQNRSTKVDEIASASTLQQKKLEETNFVFTPAVLDQFEYDDKTTTRIAVSPDKSRVLIHTWFHTVIVDLKTGASEELAVSSAVIEDSEAQKGLVLTELEIGAVKWSDDSRRVHFYVRRPLLSSGISTSQPGWNSRVDVVTMVWDSVNGLRYDFRDKSLMAKIQGAIHVSPRIESSQMTNDGRYLVTTNRSWMPGDRTTVRVFDLESPKYRKPIFSKTYKDVGRREIDSTGSLFGYSDNENRYYRVLDLGISGNREFDPKRVNERNIGSDHLFPLGVSPDGKMFVLIEDRGLTKKMVSSSEEMIKLVMINLVGNTEPREFSFPVKFTTPYLGNLLVDKLLWLSEQEAILVTPKFEAVKIDFDGNGVAPGPNVSTLFDARPQSDVAVQNSVVQLSRDKAFIFIGEAQGTLNNMKIANIEIYATNGGHKLGQLSVGQDFVLIRELKVLDQVDQFGHPLIAVSGIGRGSKTLVQIYKMHE